MSICCQNPSWVYYNADGNFRGLLPWNRLKYLSYFSIIFDAVSRTAVLQFFDILREWTHSVSTMSGKRRCHRNIWNFLKKLDTYKFCNFVFQKYNTADPETCAHTYSTEGLVLTKHGRK